MTHVQKTDYGVPDQQRDSDGSGAGVRENNGSHSGSAPAGHFRPRLYGYPPNDSTRSSASSSQTYSGTRARNARMGGAPAGNAPAGNAPATGAPSGNAPSAQAAMTGQQSARVAALDGLRALAIISIVLYHLSVSWLPSGHIGVVMFLVLTGYLVTCSLLRSWYRRGTVAPGRFLLRRLKRLWPSMIAMVVIVLVICIICNHILLTKARPDVLPSLLFYSNWAYIANGSSYFDQIGGSSPFTHLWYLSIDAQFCIVWSVVVWLAMRGGDRRVLLSRIALVGAVVSAVLMGVLFDPNADPSRVYYGTDTRAFSLLLGAWLAFIWPLGSRPAALEGILWRPERPRPDSAVRSYAVIAKATPLTGIMGIACLAGLVVIMVLVQPTSAFLYRGGMALASLLVVGLIASVLVPGTPVGAVLGSKPAVWIGSRAFALYLWHYPIFALMDASGGAWWLQVLAVAISMGAAELSLRLIERPFSSGRAAEIARSMLDSVRGANARGANAASETPSRQVTRRDAKRGAIFGGVSLALVVVAAIGCAVVPEEYLVPPSAIVNTGTSVDHGMDLSNRSRAASSLVTDTASSSQTAEGQASAGTDTSQATDTSSLLATGSITLHASAEEVAAGVYDPVMIGDSVPGDATEYFSQHVPDGLLDSYVGRRPDQMLQVLNDYLAQGVVGHVVVLQAFSNNIPTAEELDQMIAACGPDREIYLVNVRIQEVEESAINSNIAQAVDRYENVHLIDWNSYVQGNESAWLYDDLTHLRPEGDAYYIDLITNSIVGSIVEAGGSYDPDPDVWAQWQAEQQAAAEQAAAEEAAAKEAAASEPAIVYESDANRAAGIYEPLLIGDSVPGDTPFYDVFPDGYIDSYIGRRPLEVISVYQDYAAQGVVGNIVVFASFSNTTPFPDQLDQLVAAVGSDKQIYLVGTVNPDGFQDAANTNLKACADSYDNVHFIDWAAYCAGHESEWLYGDGTHVTPEGGKAYLKMIAQAIGPQMVEDGGRVVTESELAAQQAAAAEDTQAATTDASATDTEQAAA